jgi:hypothetical protein
MRARHRTFAYRAFRHRTFVGSGGRVPRPVVWLIVLLVAVFFSLTASPAAPRRPQGLECPTIDRGAVTALNAANPQIARMTTANDVDLAHEIGGLIATLKEQNPAISSDAIVDTLIAAYCPVVARKPDASAAEKWRLMQQFARVLMQQVSASAMPKGAMIIANVPVPPAVYQALSGQARSSGQTTSELMAAILSRAAGQ